MNQLFTADWHLNHSKIMFHCKRDFRDVNHMGQVFFENLEAVREPGDMLYFLGDLTLTGKMVTEFLDLFRGMRVQVCFLFGNHDYEACNKIMNHPVVVWAGDIKDIKLRAKDAAYLPLIEWPAVLCHYPMRSWNRSVHGARHLHGHSHAAAREWKNTLDVGIDSAFHLLGEYRPFTAQEVKDQIDRINKEVQF